ncbi:MAG: hypothetical protein WAK50_09265, partial [Nitrososphaeraceae archaeon]
EVSKLAKSSFNQHTRFWIPYLLYAVFPYPSYYLAKSVEDVYNKGRYTHHEISILHTFCSTLSH